VRALRSISFLVEYLSATPPEAKEKPRQRSSIRRHAACLLQETRASQTLLSLGQCSGWSSSAVAVPPPPVRHAHAAGSVKPLLSDAQTDTRTAAALRRMSLRPAWEQGRGPGALGSCPPAASLRSGRVAMPHCRCCCFRVCRGPRALTGRTLSVACLFGRPVAGRHRPLLGAGRSSPPLAPRLLATSLASRRCSLNRVVVGVAKK
jgi:hypothetical protein